MHYTQFNRAKRTIPKDFQEEFEGALIAQGKLLPTETQDENPFSFVAEQIKLQIKLLMKQQKALDDAILKAAEPDAPHRQGKKRPPSPGSP
jgi:hypothetical protein